MASTGRNTTFILLIILSIVVFLFLNMVLGSVRIPMSAVWHIFTGTGDEPQTWQNIIWKSRFPQALTALVAGAGLSISGLQMQTVFRNPLAGPSVLGISSGASMGVAFVVLFSGRRSSPQPPRSFRRSGAFDRCRRRFVIRYGTDCFRFT